MNGALKSLSSAIYPIASKLSKLEIEDDTIELLREKVEKSKELKVTDINAAIRTLALNHGFTGTFILDNSLNIFEKSFPDSELSEEIYMLVKDDLSKFSVIFVGSNEIPSEDSRRLGKLTEMALEKVVYLPRSDRKTIEIIARMYEQKNNYEFDQDFHEKLVEVSQWDSAIASYVTRKSLHDTDYETKLLQSYNIKQIYEAIGEPFLNRRFSRILSCLSDESMTFLENVANVNSNEGPSLKKNKTTKENKPTTYLIKTGLIVKENNEYVINGKLFEYFMKKKFPDIGDGKIILAESSIKRYLTPQQIMVLKYLLEKSDAKKGELVTKEDLAKLLWGEDWANNYSNWAIDKQITRLRNKLEENNFPKKLVVVRNKGIFLD
jgi:hypothetical protein